MTNLGKLIVLTMATMALGCSSSGSGVVGSTPGTSSPASGGGGATAGTSSPASGSAGATAGISLPAGPGAGGGGGSGATTGTSFPGSPGAGGIPGQGGIAVSGTVPGLTQDSPGGTWAVVPATAGPGPGPKGAGGQSGAPGAGGNPTASCAPGVVGPVVTDCGYPYASSNPLTSVTFNESEVLRAIRPSLDAAGGIISLLYNDEHAMTLGVRQVVVKAAGGSNATNFSVSPLNADPDQILNPQTGANALAGDDSGLDPSLRPLWPVLYVTDITSDPSSRTGDWQMGGRPISPNAVFGSWKSAVRTIDKTVSPTTVSVTPDADPAKNNWSFILNDPVPTGVKNEGYSAEVRWGVIFQPGHSYRLQVIVHDGDQNKVGGDCGEACIVFCTGGSTTPPDCTPGVRTCGDGQSCMQGQMCVDGCCTAAPDCPTGAQACGEGMSPTGGYLACPAGQSCVNSCCASLTCPSGLAACGKIGANGETVGCQSGESCVSGCCLPYQPIL